MHIQYAFCHQEIPTHSMKLTSEYNSKFCLATKAQLPNVVFNALLLLHLRIYRKFSSFPCCFTWYSVYVPGGYKAKEFLSIINALLQICTTLKRTQHLRCGLSHFLPFFAEGVDQKCGSRQHRDTHKFCSNC